LIRPTRLRCEYLREPLGIDEPRPRLSWWLESDERDQTQSAYQIRVSREDAFQEGAPSLWDSGRVESDQSTHVAYEGLPLCSRSRCYWQVRVWDQNGRSSSWSRTASWEMGLLAQSDWTASWIEDPERIGMNPGRPSWFRRSFLVEGDVARARVYATAHGLYLLELNGGAVADDLFRPGWTDYHLRTQYQVYDITGQLRPGENVLGAVLADGWYCGHVASFGRDQYGDRPRVLAQLEVEYENGQRETVGTGPDWLCSFGPILASDLLLGESYDARLQQPGWASPGFEARHWRPAVAVPMVETRLVAQRSPSVRRTQELQPVTRWRREGGATLFDLGQNMVGWVRLKVRGEAGTEVTVRHAEMLDAEGDLYTASLRGALATDRYILSGSGDELFEPCFTYHGFRYVEISGGAELPPDAVTGIVAHSDAPTSGEFECSNELLNRLQQNIVWSQRGNFFDVPTDCPQRDERLGWMADAQIFARTACFNMDVAAFFTKWVGDVADAQDEEGAYSDVAPAIKILADGAAWPEASFAWGDAGVIVPWTIHLFYGDERILERHFESMSAWIEYIHRHNPELIWTSKTGNNYGDWLSFGEDTPNEVVATAFFARSTSLVAEIASRLGRTIEAERYRRLAERIRNAFQAAFVTAGGRVHGDTQTAYALALRFELTPEELRPALAENLVRRVREAGWHPSTGFLGVEHLLPALSETGHIEVAYRLILNRSLPSWGYAIEHGATTIWERWDSWTEQSGFQDPIMNSFNHCPLGSVGAWLYSTVAGIDLDPEKPGFRHALICPMPAGGITWARAKLDSIRGSIRSHWALEREGLRLDVEIPAGVSAQVRLPLAFAAEVLESGQPLERAPGVRNVLVGERTLAFEIGSGSYSFIGRPRIEVTPGVTPDRAALVPDPQRISGGGT